MNIIKYVIDTTCSIYKSTIIAVVGNRSKPNHGKQFDWIFDNVECGIMYQV